MNKKEQAYVEELETRLALRFTGDGPLLPDVPIPEFGGLTKGFLFNAYSRVVAPACSSATGHSFGRDDKTTTQRPRRLYSNKSLALQAMRRELEKECSKQLRAVDRLIHAEDVAQ